MAEGLFTGMTEQDVLDARQQQAQKQALQMAQMDPQQLAVYGASLAGSSLGNAVRGLFGGTDPELAKVTKFNQVISQIDLSDPASIRKAAQELGRAGFTKEAMAFMEKATQLEDSTASRNLKTAQAEYWSKKDPTAVGGGGEGKRSKEERMLDFISDIDRKYAVGEPVEPWEEAQAQNYASQLSAAKTYQDSEGRIVQVPGKVVNRLPRGGQKPETPAPAGQPAPSAKAGLTVYETPKSVESQKKQDEKAQGTLDKIDQSLKAVGEIEKLSESWTANPHLFPITERFSTSAKAIRNRLKSIEAQKVIATIEEMKTQSQSGSTGFGALNMSELDQLRADYLLLDPESPTFRTDLTSWKNRLQQIQQRILDARKGQQPQPTPKEASPAPGGGSSNFESIVQRVMSDPRNQGKSRAQVESALRARGIK